jgi:hypothetical protein
MQAFTDAVALWSADLSFAVLDTFDLQIQFVLMMLRPSFELGSAFCNCEIVLSLTNILIPDCRSSNLRSTKASFALVFKSARIQENIL